MMNPKTTCVCVLIALTLLVAVIPARGAPSAAQSGANRLQAELDLAAREGESVFSLDRGEQLAIQGGVVVPNGVTLDLNGGRLIATLVASDDAGVRLLSDSALVNGTVIVRSRGRPGLQGGAHAPVLIGTLYGEDRSVDLRSRFADPHGWRVSGVTLSSDKAVPAGDGTVLGAPAIAVTGGASDGVIENVTVPDSSTMAGGVHLDWGTVGAISSSDIWGSAAAYRAGRAFTTHPHDIVVRAIRIGRLSRLSVAGTGSFGVRLSGVHDIAVSDVTVAGVTEAAIYHTAGDLGYEFARSADRSRAHLGIRIDGVTVAAAEGAYLLRSDSYADNIGRAAQAGYRPMLNPIAHTDMDVRNIRGAAGGRLAPNFGLRLDHQRGGTFSDIIAQGFRRGFYIDEQVYDVTLLRPVSENSTEAGISVEHPLRPPANVTISQPRVSGRSLAGSSVLIGRSDGVRMDGGGARVRVTGAATRVILAPEVTLLSDRSN